MTKRVYRYTNTAKFDVDKRANIAIIKHADNFTMELFTSLK